MYLDQSISCSKVDEDHTILGFSITIFGMDSLFQYFRD